MLPIVLVHGGGFDSRCWDLVLPLLGAPALAVDLPGRGRHPAPLSSVTLQDCAASVVGDIDAAGFDEIVLAGHSLAGCSMPFMAAQLGRRVRHAVFIACTVPEDGHSAFDTLDPGIQQLIISAGPSPEPAVMSGEVARAVLGEDLDEEQIRWCTERLVPEAPRLTTDPAALAGMDGVPSTWVRTERDLIVSSEKQLRFAGNLDDCDVVDIDAGHMCMVSRPEEVAELLSATSG